MTPPSQKPEGGERRPESNEQRYFDALKRIRRYMTPEQIERDKKNIGLSYVEYLEMSYENIKTEAERAIKNRRRPRSPTP